MRILLVIACFYIFLSGLKAQYDGIFCDKQSCYDVLQVPRNANDSVVHQAFRRLARLHHPDRQRTLEARAEADIVYKKISKAYQVLKTKALRQEYDYLMANPEELFEKYSQFIKLRLSPSIDIRYVVISLLLVIFLVEYAYRRYQHSELLLALLHKMEYRNRAQEIAADKGLLMEKLSKKLSKTERKLHEDRILLKVMKEYVELPKSMRQPTFWDLTCLKLCGYVYDKIVGTAIGLWCLLLFKLKKNGLSNWHKLQIIRWRMGATREFWNSLDFNEKKYFLNEQLWFYEKYKNYSFGLEEKERERSANSSKLKRQRRAEKKGLRAVIDFDD